MRSDLPTAQPRGVLAACILASSLSFVDGSVVNVGLPALAHSFSASGSQLSWVVDAYLLPLSALLLIGGAAGDAFGRRRLLLVGISLFGVASAACAVAPSLSWLLAGRVVQGIGAALLLPNSLAILGASFAGEERGRAVGIWASAGAAAAAIGPLLGGWLIDAVGWRSIFYINLPLAAAAAVIARRYIDDTPVIGDRVIDWLGGSLAIASLGCLTWALTEISALHAVDARTACALLTGGALAAGFVVVERRRGEAAMIAPSLVSSPGFIGLNVLTLLLYGALGGLFVLAPFVLIEACGYTATQAGAALLPLPLFLALSSSYMGRLAVRVGPRLPLTLGPLIVAVGFLAALRIAPEHDFWSGILPAMLIVAIGMSLAVAPLTTAILSSVDSHYTGMASGLNSAIARGGGLIATACASVVLAEHGAAAVHGFHIAALVGVTLSLAAGASGFLGLKARTAP